MMVGTLCLLTAASALAQDYPSRPIRIIVPTAAGGPTDTSARLIAQELTKRWGRQTVIENRAGAGTIIGSDLVAKSPPDGHTLLSAPAAIATNPASYKKLPYDALRDFAPITQALTVPNVIIIHPSLPAKNLKEFIAFAKARPGEIMYASAGHGTSPHLTMELFNSMAGLKLAHVPYKGTAPALIELLSGRVIATVSSAIPVLLPHIKSGRLRVLAVTTPARVAAMADIPTVSEAGVPGFETVHWSGLLAPAGTPADIITRLHREMAAILQLPDVREKLAADNASVVGNTPDQFGAFIKSETAKWAKVAKAVGITPE